MRPLARSGRALAPWVISAGLVVFALGQVPVMELVEALEGADRGRFLTALGCFLVVGLALDSVTLWLLFRWLAGVGRLRSLVPVRAASELLMLVSLFVGLGGLAVYAKNRYGVPLKRGSGIMLVELVHEAAAIGTLGLLGLLATDTSQLPAEVQAELGLVLRFSGALVAGYALVVALSLRDHFRRTKTDQGVTAVFRDITPLQWPALWALKLIKNLAMGLFIVYGMSCFGITPPLLLGLGLSQLVLLVRGLPVTVFGIGADQLTIPVLFGAWGGLGGHEQLVAFSLAFTSSILLGRALLGLPFLKAVWDQVKE